MNLIFLIFSKWSNLSLLWYMPSNWFYIIHAIIQCHLFIGLGHMLSCSSSCLATFTKRRTKRYDRFHVNFKLIIFHYRKRCLSLVEKRRRSPKIAIIMTVVKTIISQRSRHSCIIHLLKAWKRAIAQHDSVFLCTIKIRTICFHAINQTSSIVNFFVNLLNFNMSND